MTYTSDTVQPSQETPKAVPTTFLIGADKGGVGKTSVTRAMTDYAASYGITPRLIDTQVPNGDLKLFYPSADVVDLTTTLGQMDVFDSTVPLTFVDMSAGVLGKTIRDLDRLGILDDAKAGNSRIVLLYLLGPTVSSLNEVVTASKTIGDRLNLFFVKNHISPSDYFGWDRDPRFSSALNLMKPVTVDVVNLDQVATERCQQVGGSFSEFAVNPSNSRVLRGYVREWLDSVRAEFDRVGLAKLIGAEE